MKTFISSLLIFILIISIGCTDKPKTKISEDIKKGLRKDAKEFMESLKTILVKEMQTNGVVAAVSVCSDTAQVLTNNYGVKNILFNRLIILNFPAIKRA